MNDYKFKTDPFKHQEERFYLYRDREYHAHLWEQRCGKSKISIDSAGYNYGKGRIDALLVTAPCGVHLNWVKNEIPTHMPEHCGCHPVVWNSTPNREERKKLDWLFSGSTGMGLRCLSINIEALNTPKGLEAVKNFMRSYRTMWVIDEGSTIKSMEAARTKKVLQLADKATMRRLLNGTPVTQSPLDIYPQFCYLDETILGSSWVSFRNRHAIMETQGRMKNEIKKKLETIAGRFGTYLWGPLVASEEKGCIEAGQQPLDGGPPIDFTVRQVGKTIYAMEWRCGRASGSEKLFFQAGDVYQVITGYKNLDELQAKIAPWSDRVLKADCLDLPEKVYSKRYVELSPKQRKLYEDIRKECLAELGGRVMTASMAMTKMLRCQQIVGGFFTPNPSFDVPEGVSMDELEGRWEATLDKGAIPIDNKNPRIQDILDAIDDGLTGKGIIWARFTAEIELITKELRKRYGHQVVAELHGKIPAEQRQRAMDEFQTLDEPRYLVANPQCKGVSRGQNLCKAEWEWFYSNSFSLEDRLQAEDRPHSPGQTKSLGVIDTVAPGTLDEKVIDALRAKKNLADQVTGDRLVGWV